MTLILFWAVLAVIVGIAASKRYQRDATAWTFLALIISPPLAALLLLANGPKPEPQALEPLKPLSVRHTLYCWSAGALCAVLLIGLTVLAFTH